MLVPLAPTGSVGNITSPAASLGASYLSLAFQFVVEVAGASPTVTYKFQASQDNINWYDLGYITDTSDTISTASRVRTTTGADICFISNPVARQYQWVRVVTSGNNNVTFRAEAYTLL